MYRRPELSSPPCKILLGSQFVMSCDPVLLFKPTKPVTNMSSLHNKQDPAFLLRMMPLRIGYTSNVFREYSPCTYHDLMCSRGQAITGCHMAYRFTPAAERGRCRLEFRVPPCAYFCIKLKDAKPNSPTVCSR